MRFFFSLTLLLGLGVAGCVTESTPVSITGPASLSPVQNRVATPRATVGAKAPNVATFTPTLLSAAMQEPEQEATAAPRSTSPPAASSVQDRETSPAVADQDLAALVYGNTDFALDLYQVLSESDGNLFYSPYGISLALAMTYVGARGGTEEQMADTLRFRLPQNRLHPAFNALDMELASRVQGKEGGFALSIANSVWGQEGHGFLPAFLDTLTLNYGGNVREVDFRSQPQEGRRRVNDWVSEETEGRIEDLLAPEAITRRTRLVLANAVYFKAEWRLPFDERATSRGRFYSLDGGESRVPMMRRTANFGYSRGAGYQAVELLYKGGEMSATILLPDEGRYGEIEGSLDAVLLDQILLNMESSRIRLAMPKFELESSFDLAGTLEEMGMPNAFDERLAEFQGMDGLSCLAEDDECLLISGVAHKAFVSVDESGTEAGASTAVVVGITKAVMPEEPIEVTIDRPFILLIRDRDTGSVLFLGRIVRL